MKPDHIIILLITIVTVWALKTSYTHEFNAKADPADEVLIYSDYEITNKTPSKIDPAAQSITPVALKCPDGSGEIEPLDHGWKGVCPSGLKMQRWGNALYLWISDEAMEQSVLQDNF